MKRILLLTFILIVINTTITRSLEIYSDNDWGKLYRLNKNAVTDLTIYGRVTYITSYLKEFPNLKNLFISIRINN